ncbi:MAG: hypothetical protein K9N06_05805 [Candidatus Cloacimonetes bacterium]|nr:hypothetical protein [Candidatus Cloacimonadota bacterium]
MDMLLYPSCKLYKNGRFRLPNKIKTELLKARYQRVVILADADKKCLIVPVSIWEKKKLDFVLAEELNYPQRPQSLQKTYLQLYPELINYLNNPHTLYIEHNSDHCVIFTDKNYKNENQEQRIVLDNLYEAL